MLLTSKDTFLEVLHTLQVLISLLNYILTDGGGGSSTPPPPSIRIPVVEDPKKSSLNGVDRVLQT